jgi:hypothetical protein
MAELLERVDTGDLSPAVATGFHRDGVDLKQGLAYAMSRSRIGAVLTLAEAMKALSLPLVQDNASVGSAQPPSPDKLFAMAAKGEWGMVAYFLAAEADLLTDRLTAKDKDACQRLREAAGAVHVQLPRDLRTAFSKTGQITSELLVEQPRWLLPRPRKDQCFVAVSGAKLDDGWYRVVQYPVGDDLKEAVLRPKLLSSEQCKAAALLMGTFGETMFSKAVKSEQWELVRWLLENGNAMQLVHQLDNEFGGLWEGMERSALVQDHTELSHLCASLDEHGRLQKTWRHGPKAILASSQLLRPRLDTLRKALKQTKNIFSKGPLTIKLAVGASREARRQWCADAAEIAETSFAMPLLHRLIRAGKTELFEWLLEEEIVDVDVCDARGYTALAATASLGQWKAAEKLLDEGLCRADGCSGRLALAAAMRASHSGIEEAETVASVVDLIHKRQQRTPTAALAEYFRRQVVGEVMYGIEPRRFRLQGNALCLRSGVLQVWSRAMMLESSEELSAVVFANLTPDSYQAAIAAGMLNLSGCELVLEEYLVDYGITHTVAVVVSSAWLTTGDREGTKLVQGKGAGPLSSSLPVLARAPPSGALCVESVTACCGVTIGRVEVIVDGVHLGETPQPPMPGMSAEGSMELELLVPPRELEVSTEMSGRKLKCETITGAPDSRMNVDVELAVYIYTQVIDDEGTEFVYVASHRRDVPEDSRPFKGMVSGDGRSARLASLVPWALGSNDCLCKLQSLTLKPDLLPGRTWEADEWEDTGGCQFQRLGWGAPVKVGKIFSE